MTSRGSNLNQKWKIFQCLKGEIKMFTTSCLQFENLGKIIGESDKDRNE